MSRRIVMPDVKDFSELFSRAEPINDLGRYESREVKVWDVEDWRARRPTGGVASVSSFCSVDGAKRRYCLDVEPTQAVIEAIEKNMLIVDDYRLSFAVHIHPDETALVTCVYNCIIGSCWLARVGQRTVPTGHPRRVQ